MSPVASSRVGATDGTSAGIGLITSARFCPNSSGAAVATGVDFASNNVVKSMKDATGVDDGVGVGCCLTKFARKGKSIGEVVGAVDGGGGVGCGLTRSAINVNSMGAAIGAVVGDELSNDCINSAKLNKDSTGANVGVIGAIVCSVGDIVVITGAGVIGAGVIGTGVIGAGAIGAGVTGGNVTGEGVIGADVTGGNVTGAGVIGAGVSGARVTAGNVTGADAIGADVEVSVSATGASIVDTGNAADDLIAGGIVLDVGAFEGVPVGQVESSHLSP